MKSAYFFFAILTLLCLPSCKKDDNNGNGNAKLLDFVTYSLYPDTVYYGYNTDKQINRVEGSVDIQMLVKSGNQLHYTEYRKTESRTTADATFTLNNQGNVVSGQGNFTYNLNAPYSSQFSFAYDAYENMTNRTDVRSDGNTWSYDYTYANGDLTSVKWIYNGALYLTYNYTYDLNLPDKLKIDYNHFLIDVNVFTGTLNQHLIKHSESIFAPSTTPDHTYDFTFDLDGDGFPIRSILMDSSAPAPDTTTYHYQ